MALAAEGAARLGRALAEAKELGDATRRFARSLCRATFFAWSVATSEDLRFGTTRGQRPLGLSRFHAYVDRLFWLGTRDPAAAAKLERVMLLMDSPARFCDPSLVLGVARAAVRGEGPAPFEPVPRFSAWPQKAGAVPLPTPRPTESPS
jgi:hypothetical protein